MVFSSPLHLQIRLGTQHLLLPPLRSAPLHKTHTNEGQLRCNNTSEISETHFCFGLDERVKKKQLPIQAIILCPGKPLGPEKTDKQVAESIQTLLNSYLTASILHSGLQVKSAIWMCCYLHPWIQKSLSDWAEHAHTLTVILCSSHSSHPSFPNTISIALGKLL